MPLKRTVLCLLAVIALAAGTAPCTEEPERNDAVRERVVRDFMNKRFGMFIHWGPVSLKGTEIGWSRGGQVPAEEYDLLYKQFDPVRFDAGEWVEIAREAGMKYLVITSKHHDGFCLWDSEFTDYDIAATPFKRDILAELSASCRERGVEFSIYYSILDWYHPDYPRDSPGGRGKKTTHDMPRYYQYVKNQTREIIEKYGPLGICWFDGEWEAPWTREYGNGLYDYLTEIQPTLVINNRVSKGRRGMSGTTMQTSENAGDFDTPEQRIGSFNRERPWETCMTICRQWAWKPADRMKSLKECLRTLIYTAGGDGNLLFNVGPMPDGRIEPRQAERLREMGQWLQRYGKCIYGTRGGPFMPGKWGASTCRNDRIYLFIFEWPGELVLSLPPIPKMIKRGRILTGGAVEVEQDQERIIVHVEKEDRNEIATIVELVVTDRAFDIEPVPVYRFGKPLEVKKASASNVFQNQERYAAQMAVDGSDETRWATDSGTASAWLEVDLGQPQRLGTAWISEAYAGRVSRFELQYFDEGSWKVFFKGAELGADAVMKFEPVTAQRVRLQIFEAGEGPTINEFQLFAPDKKKER